MKKLFNPVLELTHNHGTEHQEDFSHFTGNEPERKGFGHIGFLVEVPPPPLSFPSPTSPLSLSSSIGVLDHDVARVASEYSLAVLKLMFWSIGRECQFSYSLL